MALRGRYLELSWSYLYWCAGMLLWSLLCVGYFILTWQVTEIFIGLALGGLLIVMIIFPAISFGRETWYKRLAWITVLSTLFALLFVYPLIVIAMGIWQRISEDRYLPFPSFNDSWHLVLSILTIGMSVWTVRVMVRAIGLVKQLCRGEYAS
ncbi:MAG: hypothetical protein ACM359_20960 [Bacillota bacterium]